MQRCAACNQGFQDGDDVQRVPPLEQVRRGAKSGELGVYTTSTDQDLSGADLVHHKYGCYEKYFSPVENPFVYDTIADQVVTEKEDQIRDEIRTEFDERFDEIKEMISERQFNFCIECWKNLETDDPPICLWCKSPEFVWMHQKPQGMIFCCTQCNKYWDDQEDELPTPGG